MTLTFDLVTHPLMLVIICAKYGKNPFTTAHVVEQTRQDVLYFNSFIAKSWLNDLEDIGHSERSLHVTHPLMLVIICAKYGKNLSRTACAVWTRQDVTYFSSLIAKSWLNDLEDMGQGQRSLYMTHPLMLVIISA